MKGFHQSDKDLQLEIQQLEYELVALEISIKQKKNQLAERTEEKDPRTPIRIYRTGG